MRNITQVRYGMVHGRFQPFHNGHWEYTKRALERCSHLLIGITNPDPSVTVQEEGDPQRHLPESNIFTFFERMTMIKAVLVDEGVNLGRVHIIPFPIHHPQRWRFYFPEETVQFIRVFSEWGKQKVKRLEAMGLKVEILDAGAPKELSATEVRNRIWNGGEWEPLVPPGVARVLKELTALRNQRDVA